MAYPMYDAPGDTGYQPMSNVNTARRRLTPSYAPIGGVSSPAVGGGSFSRLSAPISPAGQPVARRASYVGLESPAPAIGSTYTEATPSRAPSIRAQADNVSRADFLPPNSPLVTRIGAPSAELPTFSATGAGMLPSAETGPYRYEDSPEVKAAGRLALQAKHRMLSPALSADQQQQGEQARADTVAGAAAGYYGDLGQAAIERAKTDPAMQKQITQMQAAHAKEIEALRTKHQTELNAAVTGKQKLDFQGEQNDKNRASNEKIAGIRSTPKPPKAPDEFEQTIKAYGQILRSDPTLPHEEIMSRIDKMRGVAKGARPATQPSARKTFLGPDGRSVEFELDPKSNAWVPVQ